MNEMNPLLRFAMSHFAGGDSFLAGMTLFVLTQVVLLTKLRGRWRRVAVVLSRLFVIWGCSVLVPIPPLVYIIFAIALFGLRFFRKRDNHEMSGVEAASPTEAPQSAMANQPGCERLSHLFAGLAGCLALAFEIPYRMTPVPEPSPRRLQIIADSVTAGLNDGEDTWPKRLARRTQLEIIDASQPGATLKSGLTQLMRLQASRIKPDLLLLEIGGNDLLEGLPFAEFEKNLDDLLSAAAKSGSRVWMIELPIPPLAYRYCEAQRRLAFRHQVALVPRRFLLRVLTTAGATVDGIHLSPAGHQQLAEILQTILGTVESTSTQSGRYEHVE